VASDRQGWLTEQGRYDTINADFHSAPVCLNQLSVTPVAGCSGRNL